MEGEQEAVPRKTTSRSEGGRVWRQGCWERMERWEEWGRGLDVFLVRELEGCEGGGAFDDANVNVNVLTSSSAVSKGGW